ncbi:MAG: hypothetical protein V7L12_02805 [Nostoc sp.]
MRSQTKRFGLAQVLAAIALVEEHNFGILDKDGHSLEKWRLDRIAVG